MYIVEYKLPLKNERKVINVKEVDFNSTTIVKQWLDEVGDTT